MAATMYDFVSVKLLLGDENPEIRRLKLPLKDLTPSTLPSKLCGFLNIPASKNVSFERWSDSAAAYVALDPSNLAVYKQLYRAAKAKAKLRIKVVVTDKNEPVPVQIENISEEKEIPIIKAPSAMSSQTAFSVPVTSPRKVVKLSEPIKPATSPTVSSPLKPWSGHLTSFTVQCNNCSDTIPDSHFHCDICENNDFDLCVKCVDNGVHCDVEDHYLIKRSVVNGKLTNSTTYKVPKKLPTQEKAARHTFKFEEHIEKAFQMEDTRTCNSCVNSYAESKFITCLDCEDYDLCQKCFRDEKHGHHPAHSFKSVDESAILPYEIARRLNSGRGLRHFATCDGCDQNIVGVRYKCLNCPDWDFCTTCSLSTRHIHPGHRFVPLYDHIGTVDAHKQPVHNFVRCDGPLCKSKQTYIRGDRYKCAVCPDTDFCASCEALPTNNHDRTHPLIKLRTAVRNVSVTTFGEDANGEIMSTMGDKPPQKISKSTETISTRSSNAATQVQTIAEIKPASPEVEAVVESARADPVEVAAQPVSPMFLPPLHAHFVSDSLVDGSKVLPDTLYTQTWTLRNPGPLPWPAGCTVRYTGGDNMLNISTDRPASTKDIEAAVSSNTIAYELIEQQEVQFTVTIKTPKALGRAVSYWRLKTPQGLPFGHKLWCDVEVVAEPVKQTEPIKEEIVKEEIEEEKIIKEEVKEEENLEGSKMIFPTLEKESPASSIMPAEENLDEDVDFVEDLEHLELSDPDSDDAFLTDEEYEMLDTDSIIEEATNGKK